MPSTTLHQPHHTESAPAAIGPYVQARVLTSGGVRWLFSSGQVGIDPATGELVGETTEVQVQQVLANLREILESAGFTFADVVRTTIFLADLGDFQTVNALYAAALGEARPARSTVEVSRLPKGARVEIEMTAVRAVP